MAEHCKANGEHQDVKQVSSSSWAERISWCRFKVKHNPLQLQMTLAVKGTGKIGGGEGGICSVRLLLVKPSRCVTCNILSTICLIQMAAQSYGLTIILTGSSQTEKYFVVWQTATEWSLGMTWNEQTAVDCRSAPFKPSLKQSTVLHKYNSYMWHNIGLL